LFTNMTATIDLDLSNLLCRYAIDPVTGGIEELEPQDLAGDECGQPGSSPGNQTGSAESSSQDSTGLGTLPGDIAGDVVDGTTEGEAGLPGLPQVPGGQG
jgi:phospholipid/cholesterol/gamma-HCH transport system substrate-binding protein